MGTGLGTDGGEHQSFIVRLTWNEAGVLFKELRADHDSITRFDTAWIPTRSTMRNLLQESWSRLVVTKLIPNPTLPSSIFSVRGLERR